MQLCQEADYDLVVGSTILQSNCLSFIPVLLMVIEPQFSDLKSGATEAWEQAELDEDSQKV